MVERTSFQKQSKVYHCPDSELSPPPTPGLTGWLQLRRRSWKPVVVVELPKRRSRESWKSLGAGRGGAARETQPSRCRSQRQVKEESSRHSAQNTGTRRFPRTEPKHQPPLSTIPSTACRLVGGRWQSRVLSRFMVRVLFHYLQF